MPALGGRPAEQRRRGRRSRGGRFRTRHPAPASRGRPRPPAREPRVTAVQGRGGPAGPKPRATPARGRCPGCGGGPGPDPLSPALRLAPGGGDVGDVAPQVPLPPDTQRDSRLGGCGGRRRLGGLLRGEAGTWKRAREPLSRRYQGARPAERAGWRRHFPAAKLRPVPPPSRSPAAGAGASCGDRSQCLPLRRGAPSSGRPVVSPVCRACQKRRARGHLRCVERMPIYRAFARASSRALGPSGSSPRKAANSHPAPSQRWPQHRRRA